MRDEYPWKEYKEKNPTRFEIKVVRFGAYFYDNKFDVELDLNAVLRNLHKLAIYESDKKNG